MEDLVLTSASREDSAAIWNIRFSDAAKAVSNSNDIVPFATHNEWFQKQYFSAKENLCFVAKVKEKTVAYCRLDKKDSTYTVSIAVDPAFTGQGIAKEILRYALNAKPAAVPVVAEIKPDNTPSIKLFTSAGFTLVATSREKLTYQYA